MDLYLVFGNPFKNWLSKEINIFPLRNVGFCPSLRPWDWGYIPLSHEHKIIHHFDGKRQSCFFFLHVETVLKIKELWQNFQMQHNLIFSIFKWELLEIFKLSKDNERWWELLFFLFDVCFLFNSSSCCWRVGGPAPALLPTWCVFSTNQSARNLTTVSSQPQRLTTGFTVSCRRKK